METKDFEQKEITRLEIISDKGREYVNNNCKIKLDLQDENKTLKIFVEGCSKQIVSQKPIDVVTKS